MYILTNEEGKKICDLMTSNNKLSANINTTPVAIELEHLNHVRRSELWRQKSIEDFLNYYINTGANAYSKLRVKKA